MKHFVETDEHRSGLVTYWIRFGMIQWIYSDGQLSSVIMLSVNPLWMRGHKYPEDISAVPACSKVWIITRKNQSLPHFPCKQLLSSNVIQLNFGCKNLKYFGFVICNFQRKDTNIFLVSRPLMCSGETGCPVFTGWKVSLQIEEAVPLGLVVLLIHNPDFRV